MVMERGLKAQSVIVFYVGTEKGEILCVKRYYVIQLEAYGAQGPEVFEPYFRLKLCYYSLDFLEIGADYFCQVKKQGQVQELEDLFAHLERLRPESHL